MKTILVTGGAGFIGSHVTKALLEQGHEVVILDDFNDFNYPHQLKLDRVKQFLGEESFSVENLPFSSSKQKLHIYKADIRDKEALDAIYQKHSFNQICHLAARAGVRLSLEHPHTYYEVNVTGTLNIFELAVKHAIKSVVYASSSSVYGGNTNYPFSEDQKVDNPISFYAATKKSCEELAAVFHYLHGIHITGLRFFTVYGEWGRPDMALYIFCNKIVNNESIPVFNNGDMYRDFTYIKDIVQGVVASLEKDLPHEVINLGNSKTEKLMDFISEIEKNLGKKAEIEMLPMQQGDVPKTSADVSKAKKLLGYEPTTNIDEGIKNFVSWFKNYHKVD